MTSDHKRIKLETNNTEITGKSPDTWKLNSTHLHNQWVKEEITEEFKNILQQMKIKVQHTKIYGMHQK